MAGSASSSRGANGNVVGGTTAGLGNVIAFNAKGVVVGSSVTDLSAGNLITQNSIARNDGPGIDLANDGVTLNDDGDVDTGPNALLNFPVLESALLQGTDLVVTGWARPGTTHRAVQRGRRCHGLRPGPDVRGEPSRGSGGRRRTRP